MAEALTQVKRHFGRDAVILNTRTGTKGGLLGFGGKPFVEVTAARHVADVPVALRRGTAISAEAPPLDDGAVAARRDEPPGTRRSAEMLLAEMGQLRTMVSELVQENRRSQMGHLPESLFETYQKLVQNEVAERISQQLIREIRARLTDAQLADKKTVRAHLAQCIARMLPTAGPIRVAPPDRPAVVALIGPTGVGKTTTIAKLAANFCLRDGRRVGLITIDTYRIAAVEQLKTYARIIDVPLEVAVTPEELKQAVERLSDRDVILIDTAGRSQRDAIKVKELRSFFSAVRPDEVHLVLAGTCGERVLTETIERFREVGVDRVIFTKLDEAIGFGVILTCLQLVDAKLSYVTMGQDVPEDIRIGEGQALAELILGNWNNDPAGRSDPHTAGQKDRGRCGR